MSEAAVGSTAPVGDGSELSQLREVVLIGVPVALAERASAHNEALRRELHLVRQEPQASGTDVPGRLLALVAELEDRYQGFGDFAREAFRDAVDAGEDTVDLRFAVPAGVVDDVVRLGDLLDAADEYCRTGQDLLTLATPDDALAYRRWFLGQFVDQLGGAAAVSWADATAGATAGATTGATTDAAPAPSGEPRPASTWEPTERPTGEATGESDAVLPEGWSLDRTEDTARLVVVGDLDIESAPTLRAALARLRDLDAESLVIDASGVTFLDSVGMSVLVTGHLRFAEDERPYVLSVSEPMRRTLEVTGLLDRLPVEPPAPTAS